MTVAQLEKRVAALEKAVEELKAQVGKTQEPSGPWWITDAGRYANDPLFDEMVRLGREYRESLDPHLHKKKRKKKNVRTGH